VSRARPTQPHKLRETLAAVDLLSRVGKNDPEACLWMAWAAVEHRDWETGLIPIRQVLVSRPKDGDAWFLKGICEASLDRPEEAITSLTRALTLGSRKGRAWSKADAQVLRGKLRAQLEQDKAAIVDLKAGLKAHSDNADAWFWLGLSLDRLGRRKESIAAYDRALSIDPAEAEAWFNRACGHAMLGNIDDALSDLREAIQRVPSFAKEARTDPYFAPLKKNPSFVRLVKSRDGAKVSRSS
jgi:tetratricopeptide (TPR) repeat protein